ncbi:MAG: signal peptidase I [Bacteroidota bacterium]
MEFGGIFWISLFAIIWVAISIGQYKLFEKAGQPGWAAFVPVYSWIVWLKIIGKPVWWAALLIIPVVGTLVGVAMVIEFVKAYGKYKLRDHAAALLLGFVYLPKIGFDQSVKYLGPPDEHKNIPAKSQGREWGDALLFAGVAALIIRTFFIEAFMIPTSSMERTLMAGDFLFVSKFHYGTRMPMQPLSVPFVHNKIKIGDFVMPSYVPGVKLPYYRLPGLEKVERNDIVVFNYPAHDIHDLGDGAGKVEEISMKENYIKRCVGMPGDVLEVRDMQIYINGETGENPEHMQYEYIVQTDGTKLRDKAMNRYGFRALNGATQNPNWLARNNNNYTMFMPEYVAEEMRQKVSVIKKMEQVYKTNKQVDPLSGVIYPRIKNDKGTLFPWNMDQYGPITIPKKGVTIPLTKENLSVYWRVIDVYEDHDLMEENGKVFIDGEETKEYTFELDYYWMMGDNRHNSQDSRWWGFVPETYIVGKPLFVFFSYEADFGVRWSRIGTKYVK